MSKKNIDQLFREKLQSFEETPDEKVWRSVEGSLDQKKKSRRVVPLWWRLGGVAALIAVLFYVINPFGGQNTEMPSVTDIENKTPVLQEDKTSKKEILSDGQESDATLSSSQEEALPEDKSSDSKVPDPSSLAGNGNGKEVNESNQPQRTVTSPSVNKLDQTAGTVVSNEMKNQEGNQNPYIEHPQDT